MKIYSDGAEWVSIPNTRKRKGAFFDRLIGVNVSKNKERILVEPIYQAVLTFERSGGFTFITIGWNKPSIVIVLMPVWPFVNIIRPNATQLEASDE